jgi:hypothetical protein
VRRQSWPGSSAPGSGSEDLAVALRADPIRAWLPRAGTDAVTLVPIDVAFAFLGLA